MIVPRTLTSALLLVSTIALGQGYQLQQHEPTAAGEPFFAVRSPRYDAAHALAVGLTLNYGHNPLVSGWTAPDGRFIRDGVVISDQLVGHLDVAGVLFGRLQLSASLPVTLLERGTPGYDVAPISGSVVGDPRVGARVRLLGEDRGAFGLHVGGDLWIPVGVEAHHAGDRAVRGALGIIADGQATSNVIWALNAGVVLRPRASLARTTSGPGTTGPAFQAGAAAAWISTDEVWRVGPELVFSTGLTSDALTAASTRLEALLGGGWRIGGVVDVGPAVGFGISRAAGTPDVRALLRVAVLPFGNSSKRDASARDGAADEGDDAGPFEEGREDASQTSDDARRESASDDEARPDEDAAPPPADDAQATDANGPPSAPVGAPGGTPPERATMEERAPVIIATVTFESDSDALTTASEAELERVLTFARENPRARLRLEGHGDNRGPERWNQTLSELRAKAMQRELVGRGVSPERLEVTGHGSSRPVADNQTAAGRARNRRVEVSSAP